jgi:phosphopantetheinyl transferase
VWAQIDNWVDRRFDNDDRTLPSFRFPEHRAASLRQPEDWVAAYELWHDAPSREIVARVALGADGVAEYEQQPVQAQRQWLLGRIAAKDAVRYALWDSGVERIASVELRVFNDHMGRPHVVAAYGRSDVGDFAVSLAHCAEVAVAIAIPRRPAPAERPEVGIDVAEVSAHPDTTVTFALSESERNLLDTCDEGGQRWLWFARFWAAKEAVAKAEGTGLAGAPQRFTVASVTADQFTVAVEGRSYAVAYREMTNLDGMPTRHYVVAWTYGPDLRRPGMKEEM